MQIDDKYIYLEDNTTIDPSSYILSKSPYWSTFGSSLWLNTPRREWRKLTDIGDAVEGTTGIENDPEYQRIKKKLDQWQAEQEKNVIINTTP